MSFINKAYGNKALLCSMTAIVFAALAVTLYFLIDVYAGWHLWAISLMFILYAALCGASGFLVTMTGSAAPDVKKVILTTVLTAALCFGVYFGMCYLLNATTRLGNRFVAGCTSLAFFLLSVATYIFILIRLASRFGKIVYAPIAAFCAATVAFSSFFALKSVRESSKLFLTNPPAFAPLSANETAVSEAEKVKAEEWFYTNVVNAGANGIAPAYNFKAGKRHFRDFFNECTYSVADGESAEGSVTKLVTVVCPTAKLTATVKGTLYRENGTCEWTVFLRNTGEENSPVVTDFCALDYAFPSGKDASLYFSAGSLCRADDFELFYKKRISSIAVNYSGGDKGRSSETFLPYFNLYGDYSVVLGIGWTGNWTNTVKRSGGDVSCRVKQSTLDAYLLPDEEIRSPLVSLSFYDTKNPAKGFNVFRNWMTTVLPDNIDSTVLKTIANEFSLNTTEEMIEKYNGYSTVTRENVEYYWQDAGWYKYKKNWFDGVGNLTPNPKRFDETGFGSFSDALAEDGKKFLLWYEPERIVEDTELWNYGKSHDKFLLTASGQYAGSKRYGMWNLAEDEAREYLSLTISSSIKTNGVSWYRQDFNTDAQPFWETADREYYGGRSGITENKYVTNLYAYLDYLLTDNPELIIDNCASGGRRLDLEMCRRSVPLWRTDYNCIQKKKDLKEATQGSLYGLSLWVPYSSVEIKDTVSRYGMVSNLNYFYHVEINADMSEAEAAMYNDLVKYFEGNYYTLSPYSISKKDNLITEYAAKDGSSGVVYVFFRENADKKATFTLSGLDENKRYKVCDYFNPSTVIAEGTGRELLSMEISVKTEDSPDATVLTFFVVQ